MKIHIDNREQFPLEFSHPYITDIIHSTLHFGDYKVEYQDGYIPPVEFERKSIADLYGTLSGSRNYKRFRSKLIKAKAANVKVILMIEGSLDKVLRGYERSNRNPEELVRQLFMLWVKYDLVPIFAKDREQMARIMVEYWLAIGRLKGKCCAAKGE